MAAADSADFFLFLIIASHLNLSVLLWIYSVSCFKDFGWKLRSQKCKKKKKKKKEKERKEKKVVTKSFLINCFPKLLLIVLFFPLGFVKKQKNKQSLKVNEVNGT